MHILTSTKGVPGAGPTAAYQREREDNSSGPGGGVTRDVMHINDATINIDVLWIKAMSSGWQYRMKYGEIG